MVHVTMGFWSEDLNKLGLDPNSDALLGRDFGLDTCGVGYIWKKKRCWGSSPWSLEVQRNARTTDACLQDVAVGDLAVQLAKGWRLDKQFSFWSLQLGSFRQCRNSRTQIWGRDRCGILQPFNHLSLTGHHGHRPRSRDFPELAMVASYSFSKTSGAPQCSPVWSFARLQRLNLWTNSWERRHWYSMYRSQTIRFSDLTAPELHRSLVFLHGLHADCIVLFSLATCIWRWGHFQIQLSTCSTLV